MVVSNIGAPAPRLVFCVRVCVSWCVRSQNFTDVITGLAATRKMVKAAISGEGDGKKDKKGAKGKKGKK